MSVQRISVCQVGDLKTGEMQQFSVVGKEILLAKTLTTAHR